MLLKERRGRRRSILTRTGLKTETAIKLCDHIHVSHFFRGLAGRDIGRPCGGKKKKKKRAKKALTIFCTVAKAGGGVRSHPAVINLLAEVKVWGREEWNKLWERRVEMLQWERSGRKGCHRGVTAGRGWKADRDNLETSWWHRQLCCALRSFMPPSLSQTAELNKRATLHRTSITRPCFSHTGFHQVFTSYPL